MNGQKQKLETDLQVLDHIFDCADGCSQGDAEGEDTEGLQVTPLPAPPGDLLRCNVHLLHTRRLH